MESTDRAVLVGLSVACIAVCACAWRCPCTRTGASRAAGELMFNNRREAWWATGLSVCAIAIDSGTVARTFIGQGLRVGIAAYVPALALALAGLGLPYIVLPRILKSDSLTVTAWAGARFGRAFELYFSVASVGYWLACVVPSILMGGGRLLELMTPDQSPQPLLAAATVAAIILATAGMPTLSAAQTFSCGVMALASAVVLFQAAAAVGGWSGLSDIAHHASEAVQAGLSPSFTHVSTRADGATWPTRFCGALVMATWTMCFDSRLVQKVMCASSGARARWTIALSAGLIQLLGGLWSLAALGVILSVATTPVPVSRLSATTCFRLGCAVLQCSWLSGLSSSRLLPPFTAQQPQPWRCVPHAGDVVHRTLVGQVALLALCSQCVWALVCAVPAVVCVLGYDQLQLGFVQAAVSEFALLSGAAFVGAIGAGIVFDGVGGLSATLGAAVGHAVAVAGVALNQHAAADKSGVPSPELALVVAAAAAVPPLAALAGAACCQVLGFASSGVPARRPQPLQRALTLSSVLGTRAHVQARVLPLLSLCCWPAPSTAPRYALVGRPCDEGVWMRDVELAPLQAGSRGSHAGSVTSVASVASDSAGLRLQSTTTASENEHTSAAQSHVAPTMDQHPLAAMEVDERGSTPSTGIRASTEDSMVTAAASPPPASVDSDDDGSERVATESPRMVGASTSAAGWKGREDRRADSDSQHTITTSVRTAAYVAVFSYWLPMLVVVPGCVAAMVWLW